MNILFMADVAANPDSGAAGTEYQTIEALRHLGHHVDAVWSSHLPHKIKHGNLHYLLELPRAYEKQMITRLRQAPYDVIHVNQPHGYRAARALRRLNCNRVFIHRSHGVEMRVERDLEPWKKIYGQDDRSSRRKLASKIMALCLSHSSRRIASLADGHIVSSTQCGDFLEKVMGVPRERIAVIPQAVPPLFLQRSVSEMTVKRLNHILYVGQFAFVKAPSIVAEVFDRLARANKQLRFTWVCAREHHASVRRLLTEESQERVRLLDWMPQDDLITLFDGHGLFLFPSFFEGFGKAFLEAMSRGLCVLATDNGGAHDVIRHGINGMLAPTGSVDTLVNQCLDLVDDPNLARSISQNAARDAQRFIWERVALETVSFYEQRLKVKREAVEEFPRNCHAVQQRDPESGGKISK